jgi:hypothetical protein
MVNNQPKKFEKKGFWLGEKTLLKKKNQSLTSFVRLSGSRVNQVWPFFCYCWSFTLPGSIHPLGRPVCRSTCQVGPGLITMVQVKWKENDIYYRSLLAWFFFLLLLEVHPSIKLLIKKITKITKKKLAKRKKKCNLCCEFNEVKQDVMKLKKTSPIKGPSSAEISLGFFR